MARQSINRGTTPNDGTGDSAYTFTGKINENFVEVYPEVQASTAPTAGDDSGDGYQAGKFWLNTAKRAFYILHDATAAAAKWIRGAHFEFGGYVSGEWYLSIDRGALNTINSATDPTEIMWWPGVFKERVTIQALGVYISTAAASQNIQLGICANNPATNKPTGVPLAKTGNISAAATGQVSGALSGGSVTFEPGVLYWFGFQCSVNTIRCAVLSTNTIAQSHFMGAASLAQLLPTANSVGPNCMYTSGQTFGVWPDMTAATHTRDSGGRGALIAFQAG